jgi:hypothetical protein
MQLSAGQKGHTRVSPFSGTGARVLGQPYHVCVVHSPVRTKNCKPSAKVFAGSVWQ